MILYPKYPKKKYKIRNLGEAQTFLGIQIVRDRKKRTLTINQTKYIESMAKRFAI